LRPLQCECSAGAELPRRNRRPVSGLAGNALSNNTTPCIGRIAFPLAQWHLIRFGLLTVAGAAPELRSAVMDDRKATRTGFPFHLARV
jgi:hypothetical protein